MVRTRTPRGGRGSASALGDGTAGTPVHDLSELLGPSSGALGVLQAVAATAWLSGGAGAAVLATAGTGDEGGDDAAAALLFLPVAAEPYRNESSRAGSASEPVGATP